MLAAGTGIAAGKLSPFIAEHAGGFIELFLMLMLFFVFLSVDIKNIAKSFGNGRFSISALLINFIWTPVFTFLLSRLFLSAPGSTDIQLGFIMLMVTPCTDWYLIFTGLANGNVTLGSSLLPLNLILQIILLPVYLWLFMGAVFDGGIGSGFPVGILLKSILLVLAAPLIISNIVKLITGKLHKGALLEAVLKKSDDIQFLLLCLAIISMFASQGTLLLQNLFIFLKLLPPLAVFFIVNFLLAYITGKTLGLSFEDTVPLIFTTSARNSPVALAIAAVAFPTQPVISLVLVMGPLIELPVLACDAFILKKWGESVPY